MDRYPYHWYTILLEATRALAHIGVHFTHHVFGLSLYKVNKIYKVMDCIDDQRVLFSCFLMEDKFKDWWDAVDRRYPDGMS